MTILEMIAEWRKGCGNTLPYGYPPTDCPECTAALINAIENKEINNDNG